MTAKTPEITTIDWSKEAVVGTPGAPTYFNAFFSNSYVARVTFDDDVTVIVTLPPNAARQSSVYWAGRVRTKARELRAQGASHGSVQLDEEG